MMFELSKAQSRAKRTRKRKYPTLSEAILMLSCSRRTGGVANSYLER
jgi:hypothetical protein